MDEPFSLFVLGLAYGATVCSFSCLPYFGPYLIGSGTGFKDGVVSSCAFGAGKLSMYSALGGAAALFGRALTVTHNHKVIMGLILIAVAFSMPFVAKDGCLKRSQVLGKRFSMFVLGVVSSFMPCPPLAAVFVLATQQETVLGGVMYGFCYGLGLVISPMLLAGGGFALISHKIRQEVKEFVPYMQKIAMAIMVIIAVKMMW
ncbi:MAG: sulfite exporter TauE/SafE family protein [Desulfobulbaceae bacterium]|nr:sulfite exporter TauE/SafE family protein [Desulfobulbaceae bacterium]